MPNALHLIWKTLNVLHWMSTKNHCWLSFFKVLRTVLLHDPGACNFPNVNIKFYTNGQCLYNTQKNKTKNITNKTKCQTNEVQVLNAHTHTHTTTHDNTHLLSNVSANLSITTASANLPGQVFKYDYGLWWLRSWWLQMGRSPRAR